ncbi:flagellar hook-basal body complex protein FliE, partial [Yersinia pestis]
QPAATNSPFFPVEKGANNLSFSQVLNGAIKSVDQLQHVASEKQTAMDMGISDDLTGTMLASQKASVAFSAMVQVRNKLTSALDDVMNTAL